MSPGRTFCICCRYSVQVSDVICCRRVQSVKVLDVVSGLLAGVSGSSSCVEWRRCWNVGLATCCHVSLKDDTRRVLRRRWQSSEWRAITILNFELRWDFSACWKILLLSLEVQKSGDVVVGNMRMGRLQYNIILIMDYANLVLCASSY